MNKKKRLYKFAVRFRAKENEQNKKNNTKNILKNCTHEQQAQRNTEHKCML